MKDVRCALGAGNDVLSAVSTWGCVCSEVLWFRCWKLGSTPAMTGFVGQKLVLNSRNADNVCVACTHNPKTDGDNHPYMCSFV